MPFLCEAANLVIQSPLYFWIIKWDSWWPQALFFELCQMLTTHPTRLNGVKLLSTLGPNFLPENIVKLDLSWWSD